jgi:hypothetical protein
MELLGVGDILLVFVGPVIPPLLALFWFVASRAKR